MALDEEVIDAINHLWVLVAAIICFFLSAGFGLLEVGSVRVKNAQNIMLKNLVDGAVAALSYWAIGFAFAYGEGGNPFIGNSFYFLQGYNDFIMWFFQMVFAGTTATIVSGAVAERCRFRAYLIYSFFLTGFIYPVVSHWIWSPDGFLYGLVLDFSGSGAVHLVGGAAAMAGSFWIGPRIGKFVENEETGKIETKEIPGHNAVLAALGTFILWFGFFAFNGAACGALFCPHFNDAGRIVVVTMLAGSSGCLSLLFFGALYYKCWDLKLAMNGLLAGMVATCAGCNVYAPWASILVGIGGAIAFFLQNWLFEYVFYIDDPVGASALHMGAGIFGLIAVGFLADSEFTEGDQVGIFFGGNGKQLGWQLVATVVFFSWAFGTCSLLFYTLSKFGMLRVSEEVERMGMDTHHHGGSAYRRCSVIVLDPKDEENLKSDTPSVEPTDMETNVEVVGNSHEAANVLECTPNSLRHRKARTMSVRPGAD